MATLTYEVNEFVCPVGQEAFRYGDGEYACGSRWVRAAVAAALLGITPWRMWAAISGDAAPTDWRGWVSLDWVEGILRTRERAS